MLQGEEVFFHAGGLRGELLETSAGILILLPRPSYQGSRAFDPTFHFRVLCTSPPPQHHARAFAMQAWCASRHPGLTWPSPCFS